MKKGDYITNGEYIRKVLAVADGDLIVFSYDWNINGDTEHHKQTRENEFHAFQLKTWIEKNGWKVVEKEWRPEDLKKGDKYWFLDSCGNIFSEVWTNQKEDIYRLKTKNVHKDQELAEEALKKIME
jgi:hypothetical protein